MQVIYINDYNSSTGYSVQAIDTILSMDKVGIDVVPRSFKLATQTIKAPARIYELEQKRIDKPEVVIQHTLPNYFCYYSGFKNIGYFHCETTHFKPSNWQFYCNLMDEIWVSSVENYKACIDSGVTKPVKIVPKPINPERHTRKTEKYPFINESTYVFYHIGDFSARKNTINLIRCYLETFSRKDDVLLLIKTYVEGTSPDESRQIIQNEINNLKVALRKSGNAEAYPKIVLITDYVDTAEIDKIHANGDCFITLEKGAGYNIPAHDAAAFGNWVIASRWGGQNQFIRDCVNGNLLSYEMESVSGMVRTPYPNIYTCYEEWSNPNLNEFKELLRSVYQNKPKVSKDNYNKWMETFDYANAGLKFKELLNV